MNLRTDAFRIKLANREKTLVSSSLTIIIEWYDFALYGYLAPVIAVLFFPSDNRLTSLLSTFGVFALGFLMRPIGAVLFGHIGDRVGRKKSLILAVILMAISTTFIGLLPTYNKIGFFAPALLTLLKLFQGISVGGERSSSIPFLVEHAHPSRRGFFGSIALSSTSAGILLASAVVAIISSSLSQDQLTAWGWRIPFLLGIVAGAVVLYFKKTTEESELFTSLADSGDVSKSPISEAISHYWREILTTMGATLVVAVGFYMIFVYLTTYLVTESQIPFSSALRLNTFSMFVLMLMIPIMGIISDHIGRRKLLIAGSVGVGIISYGLFIIFSHGRAIYVLFAQIFFAIVYSMIIGPFAATVVEHFPTRVRMSGMSLGFGISFAVFGGTTPLIGTFLVKLTGNNMSPSFYLITCALISLFIFLKIRETYKETLK
ncbi:MAG: MFS transporter [Thermodesulfobacteriota bacterium]